jgi:arylsulfatase
VDGLEKVQEVPDDYYYTQALSNKAVEYIRDYAKSDKPFFLYLAHCAPHWPLHALPEDIEKYKDLYKDGWDDLRKQRFARQVKLGLFDTEKTPLPAVQCEGPPWSERSEKEKEFLARKLAVHAAMVDRIDQGIGQVVNTLEETGQLNNTVIFFLSDNGASPEIMYDAGYDRNSRTREGEKVQYNTNAAVDQLGSEISYACIGPAWANAVNTPFRYWKAQSYEGGCNTPMVIHWPKGLKTKPGEITHQVGHVIDLMPTCLELARAKYPAEYDGRKITPTEGKSLLPIIQGQVREPHEALFFEHENGRAVRMGQWKLVAYSRTPDKWELYNLAEDLTETKDLAAKYPDRVKEMAAEWDKWAQKVGLKD